jgi:hypothetical protein
MTDTGYNPQTDTFHAHVDWNRRDSLLSTVIETVSVATNTDPENLPQLYDVVDVEALEDLFAAGQTSERRASVRFGYAGCTVTVRHDGEIVVDAPQSILS